MSPSVTQAVLSLAPILIPLLLGVHAWRRRGQAGAAILVALMWTLALWAVAHALESGARGAETRDVLSGIEHVALLAASPLWLAFALRYTGRGQWLTTPRVAFVALLPMVAFVVTGILLGGAPGAGNSLPDTTALWADLAYRGLLALAGTVLLLPMLANPQWLYSVQGLCLLMGFLVPWAAATAHGLGDTPLTSPGLTALAFATMALAFGAAFARFRLLDLFPVAHGSVIEGMSDSAVVLNHRNRILDLNPAARRILGRASSGAIGRDFRQVLAAAGASPLEGARGSALLRRYEKHGRASEEIELGKGEDRRHYDVALSALHDARSRQAGRLVVLHEITERKLAADKLDRLAHYDGLTGLPNRTSFHEHLSQEISRNRRSRSLLALFFLDLDKFKAVNDTLGHKMGDLLLREAAGRLKTCVRDYDTVIRLAGDEFTVILPGIAEAADATMVAGRIVAELSRPFSLEGNEVRITSSIGICFYPADGADPATLLKNADAAMYRAKAAGKNRFELFEENTLVRADDRMELDRDLNHALENDELVLDYQPEVQTGDGQLAGVEAFLRWEHPSRGAVPPEHFMPVAKENGLIVAMERWALREACRQMRSWQERYPSDPPLTVSVNISSEYFMHPNLVGEVSCTLKETALPPRSLTLEIQESTLNGDPASSAITLVALKKLGVGLALDGFGTGFSSLANLKLFPLDTLKMECSFVSGLESDEDRKLAEAVVSLSHALGMKIVAEGVETARQLVLLRETGYDRAQGHYFTEPLSHAATAAFPVADLYYQT